MNEARLRPLIEAETEGAIADALLLIDPPVSDEEAGFLLRHTRRPEARPIGELAGRVGVDALLANPHFEPRVVVRSWFAVLTADDDVYGRDLVCALAGLAEHGVLDRGELDRVVSMVTDRARHPLWVCDNLESRLTRFPLCERDLLRIVRRRKAALGDAAGREIATHEAATTEVWHALLGTGYMNLRALAASAGARTDPIVRARLRRASADPVICAALCREADAAEFATLWPELLSMDPDLAVDVLRSATAEQSRSLTQAELLPLLESTEREARLAAVAAIPAARRAARRSGGTGLTGRESTSGS